MTDLSALRGLKERVEKAEGPDRVLDARIHAAIGDQKWRVFCDWSDAEIVDQIEAAEDYDQPTPSRVTASLDASLALLERVLPGWGYRVEWLRCGGRKIGGAMVTDDLPLRRPDGSFETSTLRQTVAQAATPALALLSALLSALLAQEEQP